MRHLVFVAPRFLENTSRYLAGFARLEGLRFSVVSQDPASAIPEPLKREINGGHFQVADVLDAAQLEGAVRSLARALGPVERLAGALEQLQEPLARVRDEVGIPGLRPLHARRFRDKGEMKRVLRAAGVPVANSQLASSLAELRAVAAHLGFPLIVKPPAGLGTRHTYRLTGPDELDALARLDLEAPVLVEQFIAGREHTCETITIAGAPVWRSGTRYYPTPLEVLEAPWQQYCVVLPREQDGEPWSSFHPLNDAALRALLEGADAVAATALTHMEWFITAGGQMVVGEVGARPPGVHIMPLMSLAHETSFVEVWCELVAFERFTPRPRQWACAAAFFRGQGPGDRVAFVEGIEEAVAAAGPALVELRAPRVGMARAAGYEGEGYALVKAATTEAVTAAVSAMISRVRVRYQ